MGGKKQAQRTKGNTRPSSSGRAAELLARDGGGAVGFVGFGSMAGDLGYVPTQGADDIDVSVDADFRMVMRKMTKKDVTTKLKATQEFTAMCKEKDEDIVKGILPYWHRLYAKIANDHDRRVREAIQQAHEQVAVKVRRNLAPHLKYLMGPWLVGQCDTYGPAASAAKSAFNAAFPPTKQTEAIAYCKEDILAYLKDNLFKQTLSTLSDPKSTPPEEMEAKYNRVMTSSLLAFRHFLLVLPKQEHENLQETYQGFLTEPKLWKYAKNKAPPIRGAFFSAISAMCQAIPQVVDNYASKLCPAVLGNIDDTDPAVCQTLWEAVLYVVSSITDCWKHINTRKAFLPKLWVIFRNAGNGSATVIYPNLLPLLSKIPVDVIGQGIGFYNEFFTNMKTGLTTDRVHSSSSECGAVITAFMECLRFSLLQHLQTTEGSITIQDHLILDQLIPLLEASIREEKTQLASSPLYSHTSSLLNHMEKNIQSDHPQKETYLRVLDIFWTNFSPICISVIDELDEMSKGQPLENIAFLLECVKSPNVVRKAAAKKSTRVKFTDGPGIGTGARSKVKPVVEQMNREETPIKQELDDLVDTQPIKEGPLLSLVCKVSIMSHQFAQQKPSQIHQKFLAKLVKDFASSELFKALTEVDTSDVKDSEETEGEISHGEIENRASYAGSFFHKILLPWIEQLENRDSANYGIDCLVDMILAVVQSCDNEVEKIPLLNEVLEKCSNTIVLHNLVNKAVSTSSDAAIMKWLKGPEFGSKLVQVTKQLCHDSMTSDPSESTNECSWMLISLGLSTNQKLEPVIAGEYMEQILNTFHQSLPKSKDEMSVNQQQLQRCVSFICDVISNFFHALQGCFMIPAAEHLLLTLFQLNCCNSYGLSDVVMEKLKETWQVGTKSLISQRGGLLNETGFLYQAATWIKQSTLTTTSSTSVRALAESAVELCEIIINSLPQDDNDDDDDDDDSDENEESLRRKSPIIYALLELMMPTDDEWDEHRMQLPSNWKSTLMLKRVMTFTDIPQSCTTSCAIVPRHTLLAIFSSVLLQKCCHGNSIQDGLEGGEANLEAINDAILKLEMKHTDWTLDVGDMKTQLLECVYGLIWCSTELGLELGAGEQELKRVSEKQPEISSAWRLLNSSLSKMLSDLKTGHWEILLSSALERSLKNGILWSMSLGYMLSNCKTLNKLEIDVLQCAGSMDRFAVLHESSLQTLECIIPYLKSEHILQLTEINTAGMLTSTEDNILSISGSLGAICVLNKCFQQDANLTKDLISSVLNLLSSWREEHEDLFLFGCNVNDASVNKINFNIEIVQLMLNAVMNKPELIITSHWDFMMCSLVSCIQSCSESLQSSPSLATQPFCCAVFDLLSAVSDHMTSSCTVVSSEQTTEWVEFFSDGIYTTLFPIFILIVGVTTPKSQATVEDHLLQCLCHAVTGISAEQMKSSKIVIKLRADASVHLPDSLQSLLNYLCAMVMTHNKTVQVTAYTLLLRLISELPKYDEQLIKEDEDKEIILQPPASLMDVYNLTSEYIDGILTDVRVGECVLIEGYSDAYYYSLAYLLSWKLLLAFFKGATAELRAGYAAYFRQHKMVTTLLKNLFRLMPETPVTMDRSTSKTVNMFTVQPQFFNTGSVQSSQNICHLSCSVYYSASEDIPAMVRQWWNSQDKRVASYVDNFTSKYASPVLCSQEIQSVQNTEHNMENMTVKGRPVTREVIATYTMELSEEVSVELVIQLPSNHPLGIVTVDSGKKIGIKAAQWRTWMLQLTTFLVHQNGSILDGLTLWKRNVDKRFEGIEDCIICFSVIHGSNCSLPRLTCRTCKKKFHSECLYKWFSTSNQSTCPACRNLF
ncbi:E3 ubiquitin-protein ligase listerin-like isoform X1 [Glandiceps talaboti]